MRLAAAIVDTRDLIDLNEVIKSHLKFLPKETDLFIFHSDENFENVDKIDCDNNVFFSNQRWVKGIADYNTLLTSIPFWKSFIDYDKLLIFQHDSRLLKKGIEDFYHVDYIGAPWKFSNKGGNGGLSLRTPFKMIEVIERFPYRPFIHGNEDVYFSNHIEKVGGKLATRLECESFSCETIFRLGTLGYHAIEKHLSHDLVKRIKYQYL